MVVLYDYDPAVAAVVLAAKNGGRRDLLVDLGCRLADRVDDTRAGFAAVTWVPASRSARRRRGYDHGAVLAKTVAGCLGVPARRLLVRRRGEAQSGSDRTSRLVGPSIRCPVEVTGRLLLVDDVVTTGASVREAARALKAAGADRVWAAAVASVGAAGR